MSDNKPTIGVKPWGSSPSKNRKYDDDDTPRLPFMKLNPSPGINDLRIVSDYATYYQARYKGPESKKSYGDKVRTAWPTYDDCPVFNDLGIQPKERFFVVVVDRSDNQLKILDMSVLVKDQIETNLNVINQRRKDGEKITPRHFEISLSFDPKAKKATGFYNVVIVETSPPSEEDLALVNDIGGEEVLTKILNRQSMCYKREAVVKRLMGLGWDGKPVVQETEETGASHEEPAEDDYTFPNAEAGSEEPSAANG